ncbi:Lysosomal alpha-glucosidase [Chionoecetes opilio]|uniref:Lysosomal alpha-glucosidase n=1 Tax=Chionoecetes opilio TaxID=41210 RepID=A0A8J4YGW8_CHIOP|nr:Lysosomal alpha-glucosidase [Chionoecetes opilio]
MVRILPPQSAKGEAGVTAAAAASLLGGQETTSLQRKKKHLQCVLTGLALLFGLWLTTTIIIILVVVPYCQGRNVMLRESLPPPASLRQNVLTYSETDTHRVNAYRNWVKNMVKEIKCGIDCLFYALEIPKQDALDFRPIAAPPQLPSAPVMPSSGLCGDITLSERFDCLPSPTPNQEECVARGCCWKVVVEPPKRDKPFPAPRIHPPTHGSYQDDDIPLNIPFCYYPKDYPGYHFTNLTPSDTGHEGYLSRGVKSGYPGDVDTLRFEVWMETDTRIRIKITDPSKARWETPLPSVPSLNTSSAKHPLYKFKTRLNDGTFTIARGSTDLPLFSTEGAAPLTYADQFLQLSTILPSHFIYGLGEHLDGLLLDTFWKRRVLWNVDQIPESGKNLYGSHPFYLAMEPSGEAHGVFLLNSNAMEIVLQPLPALTYRVIGGVLDLYVFLGPSPDDVVRQYTEVVGRPFLPPYWSLGYHQCRFGYGSTNRTREVWQRTRDAGIPFDVQWNDIDYMKDHNDFTVSPDTYKGLPRLVQDIHQAGMHYVPIIDPGISASEAPGTYPPWDQGRFLQVFVRNSTNQPFIGKVWNPVSTAWPDFTHPLATYYWSKQMQRFHNTLPYDGAWIDMNEPSNFWSGSSKGCVRNNLEHPPFLPAVEGGSLYHHTLCMSARHHVGFHYNVHNLYGLSEAIATNAALQVVRGKRPFVISRATFPGQGHYGGHWTGDVMSDWFNMWQSIPGILNFNMFGMPMVGADICGFNGNTTTNLCMRWMQLGAFYPFSRNHNTDDAVDQDPVALGERVVRGARKALTQRYTLLPYLYTLFFKAHMTGAPVARPLFFEFPDDEKTYSVDTQFLWGSAVMIVPALREHITKVEAYVPRGVWYDWYGGGRVEKKDKEGMYLTLPAPYDTIPLLILGGHILPTHVPGNTTVQSRKLGHGLVVAPDKAGQAKGQLYWDDGDSLDTVSSGTFSHMLFESETGVLRVTCLSTGYTAPINLRYIRILNAPKNATHVVVGDKVTVEYDYDPTNKHESYALDALPDRQPQFSAEDLGGLPTMANEHHLPKFVVTVIGIKFRKTRVPDAAFTRLLQVRTTLMARLHCLRLSRDPKCPWHKTVLETIANFLLY